MARASYIWIVFAGNASLPMAAFTVKHELATWVKRNCEPGEINVYRYRDGYRDSKGIVRLDASELFQ